MYNLSLGSYGPQDYAYLLRTYAARFAPEIVVIGLYLGNDLMRAYEEVAGIPSSTYAHVVDQRPLGSLRTWLAQRSMLYQVTKYSLPALVEPLRRRMTSLDTANDVVVLEVDGSQTALRPEIRRASLDRSSRSVRSGIARTRKIWGEITAHCRTLGADCYTLVIPTKILVYAPFALDALEGDARARVLEVAEAETLLRNEFMIFLEELGNAPIDPLPALRAAVTRGDVPYPTNHDGHPNRVGYRAIAEVVVTALARQPDDADASDVTR